MELISVAQDVYACLQEDKGLGCSNSGLIDRGGGLLVDSFWDLPLTRQMIEHYERVWTGPPRRVVNTHRNGDHCWGNQLFEGAEIIGHRLCAEEFDRENPAGLLTLTAATGLEDPALSRFVEGLKRFDFRGIELTPPTTLIEDRLDLELDGLRVELIYVGPAHTQGDIIVNVPERRVVFAGDIVFRLCTPVGWEGTYQRWIEALDHIIYLDPEALVPGHGPISGVEGAREMKQYLEYVRTESRGFFDAGLTELEASKRIDLGPYAGWTEPERLYFNVYRAYREFRGEPFDAPIDGREVFKQMHELARSWRSG
jgi:glyoxylase-like metal-dependent hydrolase (beta-lactamase superfamily II)